MTALAKSRRRVAIALINKQILSGVKPYSVKAFKKGKYNNVPKEDVIYKLNEDGSQYLTKDGKPVITHIKLQKADLARLERELRAAEQRL